MSGFSFAFFLDKKNKSDFSQNSSFYSKELFFKKMDLDVSNIIIYTDGTDLEDIFVRIEKYSDKNFIILFDDHNTSIDTFKNIKSSNKIFYSFLFDHSIIDFIEFFNKIYTDFFDFYSQNSIITIFQEDFRIKLIDKKRYDKINVMNSKCCGVVGACEENCILDKVILSGVTEGKYENINGKISRVIIKEIPKKVLGLNRSYYIESVANLVDINLDKKGYSLTEKEFDVTSFLFYISECVYLSDDKNQYIKDVLKIFANEINTDLIIYKHNDSYISLKDNKYLMKNILMNSIDLDSIKNGINDIGIKNTTKQGFQKKILNLDISVQNQNLGHFYIISKEFDSLFLKSLDIIKKQLFLGLLFFEKKYNDKINEKKMFQQEKMASIGQLYLGLTHEINNPNTFIYGNSELLLSNFDELEELGIENITKEDFKKIIKDSRSCLNSILKGSDRINSIIQNLKLFSRFDYSNIERVDIVKIIYDAIKITEFSIKNYGKIEFKNYIDKIYVMANYDELLQVIVNIILNSINSFEEKRVLPDWNRFYGCVYIELERRDGIIELIIRDNGVGVDKTKLKKVFDPFYTTNSREGAGLGMNVAYSVIKKFGGDIKINSIEMDFFEVKIELPVG